MGGGGGGGGPWGGGGGGGSQSRQLSLPRSAWKRAPVSSVCPSVVGTQTRDPRRGGGGRGSGCSVDPCCYTTRLIREGMVAHMMQYS